LMYVREGREGGVIPIPEGTALTHHEQVKPSPEQCAKAEAYCRRDDDWRREVHPPIVPRREGGWERTSSAGGGVI